MHDTVSLLAAEPRDAASAAGAGDANSTSSAIASADADQPGSSFLANLVREASAAALAAGAQVRSAAAAASDGSAEPKDSEVPGVLAGPQSPFTGKLRAASTARPLAATGVWNTSADSTTTEQCVRASLRLELAACLCLGLKETLPRRHRESLRLAV